MAKSKKQQNSLMKEQPSSSIDRISSLPDSVICHILSFLPTKYTVATSILSKRWKPLWFSVFTLEFFDKRDTSGPFSHIYSVLQSRDIKLPIRSFHLKLPRYCYCKSDDITQLVTAVIHRQTQNLELNLQYNTFDVKLASNIFTCRTLVVLKLRGLWMMDQIPQINNNISKLKTLHLHKALFKSTTHVIDFLLSFPMLEELQTNYVHVIDEIAPKTEDKLKYLPNLVTAKVYDTSTESIPCFLLSRARSLSVKLPWTFDQLPIFYNLNQLELMIDKNRKWVWTWVWMQDMLQHTPKLQHLIIHQEIGNETENVNDDDDIWKDPNIVLECLSSQLKTCLFKNYRGKKWELLFAEYVMSNSKVLSNMTI